jgi:hypothetical protein
MPEIHNNSENNNIIENNTHSPEQNFEVLGSQEYNRVNSGVEVSQPTVEQSTVYEAENHIKQVVETQKNIYQSAPITKPLSPKIQEKYGWLLNVPEEHRVEVSVKLITTKGKDILDVIHAFLAIEDYVALDRLEESLSAIYPTLIEEGLLPDVHDK